MRLFRTYTYAWWQIGILKLSVLLIGVVGGAWFAPLVLDYLIPIVLIASATATYIIYVSFLSADAEHVSRTTEQTGL